MLGTPIRILIEGSFAVTFFFMLSGFVLSLKFFQTRDNNILRHAALKRFFRLAIPVFIVTIIGLILFNFRFDYSKELQQITGSSWLSIGWSEIYSFNFFDALKLSFYDTFFSEHTLLFNNVLWTMRVEFFGSLLVFSILLFFGKNKNRLSILSGLAIMISLINISYTPFILGVIIADIAVRSSFWQSNKNKGTWLLFVLGIFFGSIPIGSSVGNTIYSFFVPSFAEQEQIVKIYHIFAALLLMMAVIRSTHLQSVLRRSVVNKIGGLSYFLYLMHLPILYTLTAFTFLQFYNSNNYLLSAAIASATSLIFMILISDYLTALFEGPTIKISNKIARMINQ